MCYRIWSNCADKAVYPINAMGISKAMMKQLYAVHDMASNTTFY